MKWTKDEVKTVSDTYRQLWPGDVTNLEMSMFCKALSYFKAEYVLEALYHIFSSQEKRMRPAAGRVRDRSAEIKRSDPNEEQKPRMEAIPSVASRQEIRDMLAEYYKTIGKMPNVVDE